MSSEKKEKNTAEAEPKKIRKGPKIVGRIILFVVLITGLGFGAAKGVDVIKYVSTDDAAVDGKQIKLGSRMLGRIEHINVEEGAQVKAGEVLITLDATDLRAQEKQAQASLAYARQNLELVKINLNKNRDDYNRIRNLYNSAAATRESYEHAASALDAAQAQYSLAQAQVDTAEAQLGVIEAQLLNTSISSPIAGTVDKITLSEGDVVQPGQTILSVNNLDDIWVIANIEETNIARVKPGARVRITVDAFGRRRFEGTVELIRAGIVAPAFQIGEFTKTTQRIPVRISFNTDVSSGDGISGLKLRPGMSVEVKIRTPAPLPGFLDK